MEDSNQTVALLQNVNLYQENYLVLEDICLEIKKADFFFLIGRTGGGKSTLLKSLYADINITKGVASVAGFDLVKIAQSKIPKLRRRVGIIFQDFQLFTDRSVADNLRFVLKATGWSDTAKIKNRIAEVLLRVGLSNAGNKYPFQLSGGEQQRVVIARALLNEPSIIIADEPTGNLDPIVSRSILNIFAEINKYGTSIIMATHNHYLIKEFPQARILAIDKGILSEIKAEDVGTIAWY